MFHLRIDFKTVYYVFYSGNKSLQYLAQSTSFPSQKSGLVSLLFVIIVTSVTLRKGV